MRRRELGSLLAGAAAIGCFGGAPRPPSALAPDRRRPLKVIAFDAFPIFDPRPVGLLAEQLFPSRGKELMDAWRSRQFEYQWLRALGGRYADFPAATAEALVFALRKLDIQASADARRQLVDAYRHLKAWPDVAPVLAALREGHFALAFLSNMTEDMLRQNIASAGFDGAFDFVLSTDAIKTYKPDPRAYRLALERLAVKKDEVLFVPFAGWDAAGATWFGYETFWLNRPGAPAEELAPPPDGTGRTLDDLLAYVRKTRA